MEKLMTPEMVADALCVSGKTVRDWLRAGKLQGIKVGTLWRVEKSAVEQFVVNGRVLNE